MNNIKNILNIKTVILLFLIVILIIGGYVFLNKDSKEPDSNNNEDKNNKPVVTIIDLRKECWTLEQDGNYVSAYDCKKYLTINSKNVDLNIITKSNEDQGYSDHHMIIEVNNNKIFEYIFEDNGEYNSKHIEKIEVFKDLLIISPSFNEGGEEEAPIVVIDQEGNVILDFAIINLGENFAYNNYVDPGKYEIKDNKIIFERTLAYYGGSSCAEDELGNCIKSVRLFIDNEMIHVTSENYDKYANTTYLVKYEFEYLGNGDFSEMKQIEELKFKDVFTLEELQKPLEW